MKPIFISTLLTAILGAGVCALSADTNVAAPFMQKGAGSRASAMGECYTAVAQGPFGHLYNPAGLGSIQSGNFGLEHENLGLGISHEGVGAAIPLGTGGLGALINYFSYGSIAKVDETGQPTGEELTPSDTLINLGYGFSLAGDWRLGANLGLYSMNLGTVKQGGMVMDIGAAWDAAPDWSLAAVIKNLGSPVGDYKLPASLRLAGGFWGFNRRLLVDTELDIPFTRDVSDFGIGAEFRIWNWLDVRAGFKTMMKQSDTSMESLMLGIGFNFMNFGLDLAITGREGLDMQSSLTLGYGFQGLRAQPLKASKPTAQPTSAVSQKEALVQELEKVKKAAKLRAGPDITEQAGFHYQAGQEYEKYGKTIDAIVEYQAALKVRPDYPEAQAALTAARRQARVEEQQSKAKKTQKARPAGSLQKLIRKYYERGLAAYKKKDYSTAIKQLQLVLEMTSQHQQATNLLNKAKEALDHEQAVLRRQAKQAGIKGDLAGEIEAYRKMQDLDPGNKLIKTKLDQAVKKIPITVERLYKEGLDAYAQGRFRPALKSFETLLKIQPDHVKARDAVRNIKEKLIQTGQ